MPISKVSEAGLSSGAQFNTFKNRIINGAMVIDQRNAGASVTPGAATVTYTLDRFAAFGTQASKFSVQQNAGSVTPPVGFKNYLGVTSLSAYTVGASEAFWIRQPVEGFNIADFGWGTASATPVTLSFWVRSSLTGTFGGSIVDNFTPYSYPFSYTISAANTWEQKTVTIVGPTSGSFPTGNTAGFFMIFGLGVGSTLSGTAGSWTAGNFSSATGATSVVGTNGATFYITGVQLEKGSTATSFDYRPYTTELQLCQRYYYRISDQASYATHTCGSATIAQGPVNFQTTMRIAPTALEQSGTASDYYLWGGSSVACSSVPIFIGATRNAGLVRTTVASGLTAGQAREFGANSLNAYLAWSAEL